MGGRDVGSLCGVGMVLELHRIAHLVEQSLGSPRHTSLQKAGLAYGDKS